MVVSVRKEGKTGKKKAARKTSGFIRKGIGGEGGEILALPISAQMIGFSCFPYSNLAHYGTSSCFMRHAPNGEDLRKIRA